MLGIRLDDDIERDLNRLARRTGRSKSQIARTAIRDYLVRNDRILRAKREWIGISRHERDDAEIGEILDVAAAHADDLG